MMRRAAGERHALPLRRPARWRVPASLQSQIVALFGGDADAEIVEECVALVREKIGAVAAFKQAVVVPRLPKTVR